MHRLLEFRRPRELSAEVHRLNGHQPPLNLAESQLLQARNASTDAHEASGHLLRHRSVTSRLPTREKDRCGMGVAQGGRVRKAVYYQRLAANTPPAVRYLFRDVSSSQPVGYVWYSGAPPSRHIGASIRIETSLEPDALAA